MKAVICDQCGTAYRKDSPDAWNLRDRDTMAVYDLCSPACVHARVKAIGGPGDLPQPPYGIDF